MPRKPKELPVPPDGALTPREIAAAAVPLRMDMLRVFRAQGLSLAAWGAEVQAVARAAAAEGDFAAAFKGYDLLGRYLGAFREPVSQHVHIHAASDQWRAMSDTQLRALAEQADAAAAKPVLAAVAAECAGDEDARIKVLELEMAAFGTPPEPEPAPVASPEAEHVGG